MCSRRHGEVAGRSNDACRKTDISSHQQKVNRRTTVSAGGKISFWLCLRKVISRKTVARRLRGGGLYVYLRQVCPIDQTAPYLARLQWCREHHNWTEQTGMRTIFV
ncbi:hypothetical protein TNCV_3310301 [Trichonephila clavipes]|uniref:Transposase Tc1-like domain-containing protein n=1 Tax=Trichonephila clavipes TaxID=2585209 RepID=A0A8X6SEZ6_TRICX|nr:hypothetical protein TNCV_3310301 [Trichonephila clavipes]